MYDYLSVHIAVLLFIAGASLLAFWVSQIFRGLVGVGSLTIGVHNDTAILLEDYTPEEVREGLVPSAGDFTQLLRSLKAQRFPPRRISTFTCPAILQKYSLHLNTDGPYPSEPELDDQTRVNLEFFIDCSSPVSVTVYWDVPKEEINQLCSALRTTTPDEPKKAKGLYEKLTSSSTSIDNAIAMEEEIERAAFHTSFAIGELPAHYAHKSSEMKLEEGLKQSILVQENDSVLLRDLLAFTKSSLSFPLVIVVLPIHTESLEEHSVLICPVEVQITKQEETVTGIQATLNKQYIFTKTEFHELQDVFGIDDEEECVVCLTELKDTTLLPCNHFCVCQECFGKIETCPICRTKIEAFLRFYHEPEGSENISASGTDKLYRDGEAEIEIVQ